MDSVNNIRKGRLHCSLVNALTMPRLAINLLCAGAQSLADIFFIPGRQSIIQVGSAHKASFANFFSGEAERKEQISSCPLTPQML